MNEIMIALGTNLGNRKENLETALSALEKFVHIKQQSNIYESKPWGYTEQPNFLNMVIRGNSSLSPLTLLTELKNLEATLGRKPNFRYGPRLIDLDIIFYGQEVVESKQLTIPHPHYLKRDFVLLPLCEIAPNFIPAAQNKTILELTKLMEPTEIYLHEVPSLKPFGLRSMLLEPELMQVFNSLPINLKQTLVNLLNQPEMNSAQVLTTFLNQEKPKGTST